MLRRLVLAILVACTPTPHSATVPAEPVRIARPPAQLPELDEAAVTARSHAFFDAIDRDDLAAFSAALGPAFVLFEDSRFMDEATFTKILETQLGRHAPVHSRTWSDEHVYRGHGTAVFIGRALEHVPVEPDHPAAEFDGYNTLVWARDGERWQVVHWQWARAGVEAERQRWNDYFRASVGFKLTANQLLVDTIRGRKPGTALDVEMGQGRNALYLASQGWKTTGVDISDEGIKHAKEEAAKQKLKLDTIEADVDKFDFGKDRWDLVTLIYAGNSADKVRRILPSLKKGGLFICEYFHKDSEIAKTGAGGWDTGELAALFKDGFKILRDDVVEDNADWAGQRKTKLVRFVAQKL